MKDNRFIELVNLYIDRQISAAEAEDLEAEMQANPRRRAVYRQYCQMHRATTLVYESFRSDAPEQQTGLTKNRATIARFDHQQRHRRIRWSYYAGGLAAAACLALVLVRLNSNPSSANNFPIAAAKPAPISPVAVAFLPSPATATAPRQAVPAKATFVSLQASNLQAEQKYAELLAVMRQEEQRAMANGTIQSSRLPSLFDDGVFETQQGFSTTNQRVFRSKQTPAQQAEFTAFQFQR